MNCQTVVYCGKNPHFICKLVHYDHNYQERCEFLTVYTEKGREREERGSGRRGGRGRSGREREEWEKGREREEWEKGREREEWEKGRERGGQDAISMSPHS